MYATSSKLRTPAHTQVIQYHVVNPQFSACYRCTPTARAYFICVQRQKTSGPGYTKKKMSPSGYMSYCAASTTVFQQLDLELVPVPSFKGFADLTQIF